MGEPAKWTDKAVVILTGGILIAAALQTYIFHRQRTEMTEGGKQTDKIIGADQRLADANERFAGAMEQTVKDNKIALDKTVQENKRALRATLSQGQKALDSSIAASRADERAYVTIGKPDGTVAEIIWPKDDKGTAGLLVYFQNNGRLPAKFNWGADSNIIAIVPSDPTIVTYEAWKGPPTELPTNHLFQPMYRARSKDGKAMNWSGTIDIAGGSSYQGVLWETPKERMTQLIEFDRMFMPSGMFEYCDGFGKRVCRNFHIRYAKEPYSRFFLVSEGECPAYEMQIRHPSPDLDYLPPCDTAERKEFQVTIPSLPKP
jgi:hypothetical protein